MEGSDSNGVEPPYSTSSRTPSYTSLPLIGEEIIQHTPRPGVSPANGVYTRQWKTIAIAFRGQEEGVCCPVYHGGLVAGTLELKSPKNVLEVFVKLEGKIASSVSDVGARVTRLVQEQAVLWKGGEEGFPGSCPKVLPFALQFPLYFVEDGRSWRLPPSFEANSLGIPAMFSRCSYTLSVVLKRRKNYHLASWVRHKTYSVLLEYRPRNRPSCPAPRFESISSVKSFPEEWTQLISSMEVKRGSSTRPVDCHFLIPAASTYSLSDSIPFHVQLSSSLGRLQESVPLSRDLLWSVSNVEGRELGKKYPVRVYLAREITLDIHGKKTSRVLTIGTGIMRAAAPTDPGLVSGPSDVCLEWEGDVKYSKEAMCGGFFAGSLCVKDYLVLELGSAAAQSSHAAPMQIVHPVKLVTDRWTENEVEHPREA